VSIGGIALHLRGELKELFMDWLRDKRPDLVPRYERLYARGAYAPKAERDRLMRLARGGRERPGRRLPPAVSFRNPPPEPESGEPDARHSQPKLF
jgi:hypothetical protein